MFKLKFSLVGLVLIVTLNAKHAFSADQKMVKFDRNAIRIIDVALLVHMLERCPSERIGSRTYYACGELCCCGCNNPCHMRAYFTSNKKICAHLAKCHLAPTRVE